MQTVRASWVALIGQMQPGTVHGKVVIAFQLKPDGAVTNLVVQSNTAGAMPGVLAEKTIIHSAPFPPLPDSLRKSLDDQPRDVEFKFVY